VTVLQQALCYLHLASHHIQQGDVSVIDSFIVSNYHYTVIYATGSHIFCAETTHPQLWQPVQWHGAFVGSHEHLCRLLLSA